MRIFYASDNSPNASLNSNLWRNNLYQTLVDMGHDVVEFQYDLGETFQNLDLENPRHRAFIDHNRPLLERELLRQVEVAHAKKPIDVFFSYFYAACATQNVVHRIRAMGIKTVNWYCNGSYQFHLVSDLAPAYDLCMVPEKFRIEDYRRVGATPIYSQEAANPKIYKPYDLPQEFDVAFIGQSYGDRPAYIRYLCDQGIDVRVWGFGWQNLVEPDANEAPPNPAAETISFARRAARIARRLFAPDGAYVLRQRLKRIFENLQPVVPSSSSYLLNTGAVHLPREVVGPPLSDLEMVQMYSRAKINLGFSTCGETHRTGERILQVRLRDFEVPMSGGFYMVEHMEELQEFFEIGKEIVCYTDPQDLAEKIKYYLAHDSERERIRRAGRERCLRDHTWQRRFERVFEELALT